MKDRYEFDIETKLGPGHAVITLDPYFSNADLVIDGFDHDYEMLMTSMGDTASPAWNLFVTWDSIVEMAKDYHVGFIHDIACAISKWPNEFYFYGDLQWSSETIVRADDIMEPLSNIMRKAFDSLDTKTCLEIVDIVNNFEDKRARISVYEEDFRVIYINNYTQQIKEIHWLDFDWAEGFLGPWYLLNRFEYKEPFFFTIKQTQEPVVATSERMKLLNTVIYGLGLLDTQWAGIRDCTLPRINQCKYDEVGDYAILYSRIRPKSEIPSGWFAPDNLLVQYKEIEFLDFAYKIATTMNDDHGRCYDIREMKWRPLSERIAEEKITRRFRAGGFLDWVDQNFEEV